MSITWQQCLSLANATFSDGLTDEGREHIARMQEAIIGLDPEQKMLAIASAARMLEQFGRVTDAIAHYEQLIELARKHDPNDIRTARDMALVARLYHQIGAFEQEGSILCHADKIYANLAAESRLALQTDEIERFNERLDRNRAILAARRNVHNCLNSQKEVLGQMASILRNGFSRILAQPAILVQEMHNGLIPFSESPLACEVAKELRAHLATHKRSWIELVRIAGPGAEGCIQRQFVKRTFFPDVIGHCTLLGDGTTIAFSDRGEAWMARAGEEPWPLLLPNPGPGQSLGSFGNSLGMIDEKGTLRFYRWSQGVLTDLNVAFPDALLLANTQTRYVALFADGTLDSFLENGVRDAAVPQACEDPHQAYRLLAMDDSRTVLIVQTLVARGRSSRVRKVCLNPPKVDPAIEIPSAVRGIAQSHSVDTVIVGSLDGLRDWNMTKPFPERKLDGTADHIIRSSDGRYVAMFWNGVRVIEMEASLEARVPLPGGAATISQLFFDDSASPPLLHVVIGERIETWELKRLFWRPSEARFEGWVEKGVFSADGSELVAISPIGVTYLWKVDSGALVEFEKAEPSVSMISWAPGRNLGAICSEDAVEIFDGNRIEVAWIPDRLPCQVAWSGDGRRLAWVGLSDPHLRWAERTTNDFRAKVIRGEPGTHSLSPSLSPDGATVAFVRGRLRIPNMPELGISARIDWSQLQSSWPKAALNALDDPVIFVDLDSEEVAGQIRGPSGRWRSVWWLSNRYLFASDEEGRAAVLDRVNGDAVVTGWTDEPAVGGCLVKDCLRICDQGMSAVVGPTVYDFRVYKEGELLQWD